MPDDPLCPACDERPRRRNASRRLMATCGAPACVEARRGSRAGVAQPKTNFRLGPGGHVCGDANSFAEGASGHYSCGGKGKRHTCVRHGGYCRSHSIHPQGVPAVGATVR